MGNQSSTTISLQVYISKGRNCQPEVNQGKRVVLDLTEGLVGHNVTCDNLINYRWDDQAK